jgi:hypothetical protein
MNRKITLTIIKLFAKVWFNHLDYKTLLDHIELYFKLLDKSLKENGPLDTIKNLKAMRLVITRYQCNKPLFVSDRKIGITKDGFPKQLLFLKEFVDSGEVYKLRFVNTLLCITRIIKCKAKPDFSSITDPYNGSSDFSEFKSFIPKFVKDFNLLVDQPYYDPSQFFYVTSKAGPLGSALTTSLLHLSRWTGVYLNAFVHMLSGVTHYLVQLSQLRHHVQLFPEHLKPKFSYIYIKDGVEFSPSQLLDIVNKDGDDTFNLIYHFKSDHIKNKLGYTRKKVLPDHPLYELSSNVYKEEIKNRRLSIVNDPEGKARVIAILDYYSQATLKLLNKELFKRLKNFSQDRTFTQAPFIGKKDENQFHSLDLSCATDRFPILLQEAILRQMMDRRYSYFWMKLLVHEPFYYQGEHFSYKVGQPMGAYSSWAMFTLSHHFIVQYCANLIGEYPTKDYIMLGDDIVINNDNLANKYKEVIASIGVAISDAKSHSSYEQYEFAKRWFRNGIEISGIPLRGLVENNNNPYWFFNQ